MTEEEAIAYYESKQWENLSSVEKVRLQLYEPLLCMPFSVFHAAVEDVLGRPVQTIEFGWNVDGLKQEFEAKTKEN